MLIQALRARFLTPCLAGEMHISLPAAHRCLPLPRSRGVFSPLCTWEPLGTEPLLSQAALSPIFVEQPAPLLLPFSLAVPILLVSVVINLILASISPFPGTRWCIYALLIVVEFNHAQI